MNQTQVNGPVLLRYVYAVLTIIGIAVTTIIVALYTSQQNELKIRDRIEFIHFASVTASAELAREAQTLARLVSDALSTTRSGTHGLAGVNTVQAGYAGILASMRARLSRLPEVPAHDGEEVIALTLKRLSERFDRIDHALRFAGLTPEIADSIEVLRINVEQFIRLHQIAAERELLVLAERQSRRPRFLGVLLACLAFSVLAGTYLILSLRSTMKLQRETEGALAESQERLHHIQKLDALGRLVGGVAHDFNNWLTVILGHADLLRDKVAGDEQLASGLGEIRQAGLQAASLTQRLLAFSHRQQLLPRIVTLDAELRDMEPMLQRIIGEDVKLTFRYATDPYTVEVDPDQLQQVLMNLISNARDAMPRGGDLTVRVDNISVGPGGIKLPEVPDGDYSRLTVSDSGTGVDEATRQRMFEPFFTTKEEGHGTGLGLSTVHGIVTGSKGHITVNSVEGSGTRFHIFLPRVDGRVGATANDTEDVTPQRGDETILVVEDDKHVRQFVEAGLSSLGYRVLSAPGGAGGLDLCRNEPGAIDVILSDIIMPEISGPKFMAAALKLRPDAVPIYMSAYTRDEVLRFRKPGSVDIPLISKPFTLDALSGLIRERLNA